MIHRASIRPMYSDVDAMNVVYYGNYLRFFELGRTELMRAAGKPYAMFVEKGRHLPVSECHINYRRPALYDDLLQVETRIPWVKKASLRFDYNILRSDPDGAEKLLITGHTVHACINFQGRVTPFPEELLQGLQELMEPE
jgi:acyl-CoA thioester hydrolase